ncbi:MAG: CDP-diacylglycerol--glycerol-3-phosphate 3-phosphatidyltransferase [Candidatus Omnitrophica bacterium]|nr:CDP-diacylglycerol--glycerol-3-phosphate 3-phosphatidyltransferase [Candidatus Omnitrophota bacterium]
MNLPNKLTVSRIILTAVFLLFLFGHGPAYKAAALFIFLLAALTDLLDGYLARTRNVITDFGRLMDPIADKVLTLSAFFAFIEMELIPAWMVIIIVMRELVITGLRILALTKKVVLPAEEGGKHKTVSQMFAIIIILVSLIMKDAGFNPSFMETVIYIAMLITVAFTLISGSTFFYRNRAVFK